jgi:hypothetical protein
MATIPADANKETMIAAIVESLAQGRPVISFGITSPPEAGLVTGYDEDGGVLYGWSYFQDRRECITRRATGSRPWTIAAA